LLKVKFQTDKFNKEMNSILNYASGFLDGAQAGKKELMQTIGEKTTEYLDAFIDSNARINPEMLHHVYEWYENGSPNARLFDLQYSTHGGGLTFSSTFRQSSSVAKGSHTPFYDKARIMELGVPVVIKPVTAQALRFEDGGQEVFVKGSVTVESPGGASTQGGFQEVVDSFFRNYFSQSVLFSSGLARHLSNPVDFKTRLPRAKKGGRAQGFDVGYRWISAKGVI
jgi:hypothetical protein